VGKHGGGRRRLSFKLRIAVKNILIRCAVVEVRGQATCMSLTSLHRDADSHYRKLDVFLGACPAVDHTDYRMGRQIPNDGELKCA
jgi:hypothetical protein